MNWPCESGDSSEGVEVAFIAREKTVRSHVTPTRDGRVGTPGAARAKAGRRGGVGARDMGGAAAMLLGMDAQEMMLVARGIAESEPVFRRASWLVRAVGSAHVCKAVRTRWLAL